MDKILQAVLHGNPDDPKTPSKWSNGKASVEYRYRDDMWVWKTPDGSGVTNWWETAYDAVKPYL